MGPGKERLLLSTEEIIARLWSAQRVRFATDYDEEFIAVLSRPGGLLDVVIHSDAEPVGFITLKNEKEGLYSIVNDNALNPHLGFINTPGHGIEVKKKHRKKGIGAALLSLGIAMAQQDYKTRAASVPFKVVATDITPSGLGCYRSFGFHIKQGLKISAGEYTDPDSVPPIDIRPWKMPLPFRIIRRLQRGR